MTTEKSSSLSSVTNAMKILRLFSPKQMELSVAEISQQMNLPTSSAHRLITSLTKEGFLSKNPRSKKYRLGLAFLSIGGVIFSHRDLYQASLSPVRRLSKEIEETVHICLMEDRYVVYLFRTEVLQQDRLLTQIGRQSPLFCTSEGLCILAFQEEKVIKYALNGDLYAYTSHTETDKETLLVMMKDIKEDGHCILSDSYYETYTGISVPIRNWTGAVISSLSAIGPTNRLTGERQQFIVDSMKKAAEEISAELGYLG
ncbi:IclR family transcriptional regulator [Domibacillus robiginosus]|uniref:IclR family transcriptional regulator n=1 Tax=Domibacillus robiginosus TaxID=1071054 RepID=UPI00067A802E|nr:IclR family transcriptional regulator [Domibacillus robiginosus]